MINNLKEEGGMGWATLPVPHGGNEIPENLDKQCGSGGRKLFRNKVYNKIKYEIVVKSNS
jgi:hypothetical protein